ncbi:MAG: type II secretion system protein GspG [Nitrospirota bacterium]
MSGRTVVESLIVLSLIGILIWVFMGRYERVATATKEEALKMELYNIRLSIKLFRLMNKRYPTDITELTKGRFSIIGTTMGTAGGIYDEQYLKDQKIDEEGNPLDPFGNTYKYNPEIGKIHSQTPGYEAW